MTKEEKTRRRSVRTPTTYSNNSNLCSTQIHKNRNLFIKNGKNVFATVYNSLVRRKYLF